MQEITIKLLESDYKRLTKMAQHTGKSIQTLFYEWIFQLPELEDSIDIIQDQGVQMEGYDSDAPADLSTNLDKYIYGEE